MGNVEKRRETKPQVNRHVAGSPQVSGSRSAEQVVLVSPAF
jgi:hypothetical protein